MIKYVLNSGGLRNQPELSRKFFTELVQGFDKDPTILLCFFATPRELWEEKFQQDLESIPTLLPGDCKPKFAMAMPATFVEQVSAADVVYFHGGDDYLIQYWLRQFDIPAIFEGRVIGTNSASSHALAKHFWTCDWRQCMDGLGVLPIKFLAHYKSSYGSSDPRGPIDWDSAYEVLSQYGDSSLPIHALSEGQFVVIEA